MKYWMIALITIIASSAFAQTEISGEVSGVWTADDSPYIVVDSTWVPEGDTLTIEAGVDVLFGDSLGLDIFGMIQALGTEEDSVRFLSNGDSTVWRGVYFYGERIYSIFHWFALRGAIDGFLTTDRIGLRMQHCNINVQQAALHVLPGGGLFCDWQLSDCSLLGSWVVGTGGGRIIASHCMFLTGGRPGHGGDWGGWGVNAVDGSLFLYHCIIYGGAYLGWGISSYWDCQFLDPPDDEGYVLVYLQGNNTVMENCVVEGRVKVNFGDSMRVDHSVIDGSVSGELAEVNIENTEIGRETDLSGMDFRTSTLNLENCTVGGIISGEYYNFKALNCRFSGPLPEGSFRIQLNNCPALFERCFIEGGIRLVTPLGIQFVNNTVYKDTLDNEIIRVLSWDDVESSCEFRNNIFYCSRPNDGFIFLLNRGADGEHPEFRYNSLFGYTELFRIRADFELDSTNIFVNPLLVDPLNGDFNLTEDSPCIDAGDPNSPLDPDETRTDIGLYYFPHEPGSVHHKDIPQILDLVSVYPNPFNNSTQLLFNLAKPEHIKAIAFDVSGRKVVDIVNSFYSAGEHSYRWEPSGLSSGRYFVHLDAGTEKSICPITLIR